MLFHIITHSPSCKHLTSHLSFQHPVFQHQLIRIPGSPRIVTRLPLPKFTLIGTYLAASSSFHPFCTTLTLILQYHHTAKYFSLWSSVVSSLASYYIYLPAIYYSLSPYPLYKPSPSPCCNKNFVKLNLYVSLSLAKRTTSKVNKRKREKEKRSKN